MPAAAHAFALHADVLGVALVVLVASAVGVAVGDVWNLTKGAFDGDPFCVIIRNGVDAVVKVIVRLLK